MRLGHGAAMVGWRTSRLEGFVLAPVLPPKQVSSTAAPLPSELFYVSLFINKNQYKCLCLLTQLTSKALSKRVGYPFTSSWL